MQAARLLETWRARGLEPRLFELGGVLGLHGEVLDNRVTVVGLREFRTRPEAVSGAGTLAARHRTKVVVHEELRELPTGVLEVLAEDGTLRARVRDLLWVTPAQGEVTEVGGDPYRGTLYATLDAQGNLAVANVLAVEEMLQGVVPAEIPASAPAEALKAQAVTARGDVLAKIGTRHFADPYRVCAREHCQAYKGLARENPRTTRAVRDTRGEVLWGDRGVVNTVYSANCGGHTENNEVAWAGASNPHLRGRPDGGEATGDLSAETALRAFLQNPPASYCARPLLGKNQRFRWKRRLSQTEIAALVAAHRDVGEVRRIEVVGRGVSGRVAAVRVEGTRGELVVEREYPVRRLFGGLFSGMFVVEPTSGEGSVPAGFVFRGGGWGHGVGMCQMGAMGMARAGKSFTKILQHYYSGGRVRKVY
jgi:SpoIID/LytB domain protein